MHLFDIRPAMQFNQANDRGFLADKGFWEEPGLRRRHQLLPGAAGDGRGAAIRDAQGAVVRELSGEATKDAGKAASTASTGTCATRRCRRWPGRRRRRRRGPPRPLPARPNVLPGRVSGHPGRRRQGRRHEDGARLGRCGRPDERRRPQDLARHLGGAARDAEGDARRRRCGQRPQHPAAAGRSAAQGCGERPAAAKAAVEGTAGRLSELRRRLGLVPGGGFQAQQNVRGQISQLKGQVMNSTSLPTAVQLRTMEDLRATWRSWRRRSTT